MKIPYRLNPFGKDEGGGPDLTKDLLVYIPLDQQDQYKDIINNQYPTCNPTASSKFYSIDNVPGFDMRDNQNTGYINYAQNIFPSYSSSNLAFSFWFKLGEIYNGAGIFYFGGNATNKPNIKLSVNNSLNVVIGVRTSSNQTFTLFEADKRWHNYTILLTPTSFSFYLDGTLKLSESFSTTDWSHSGGDKVLNLGFAEPFYLLSPQIRNASSSSLRMYTRNLSIDEISLLAAEFTPIYEITASDQTLSGFNPAQLSTQSITYTCSLPITFQIISGDTLPNTITFNTSTGQFTGKALTDADHTYNLVVRMSGQDVVTKDINVAIETSATSTLTVQSPQTFNFITEASDIKDIEMTTQTEEPSFTISSGTLPSGVSIYQLGNGLKISSAGTQTSNETQQVQIAVTTPYHPTPVNATININVTLNQIIVPDKSFIFYIDDGSASKQVEYTTQNTITPVYSLSGTLPNGITFDTSTGTFTYDGVYDTPTSGEVNVIVNSSTGCSAQGIGKYTFEILSGSNPMPSGALFYMPLNGVNYMDELAENRTMSYSGTLTPTIFKNVPCLQFDQFANIFNTSERGSLPTGNHSLSLSIWVYQNTINVDQTFIFYGKQATKANLWIFDAGQQIKMGSWAGDLTTSTKGESKWHHYVATYDKDQSKYFAYRDGVLLNSSNVSNVNLTWNGLGIGRRDNANDSRFRGGYMAAARIYDRALTQEEITKLSQEFTPTE